MSAAGEVPGQYAFDVRTAALVSSPARQLRAMAYLLAIPGTNPGTCSRLASGAAARLRPGYGPVGWLVAAGLPPTVAKATVDLLRGKRPDDGDLPGARNDTGRVPQ